MDISFNDSLLKIKVDAAIYSLNVVHKCFYWYTGKYSVDISSCESGYLITISNQINEEERSTLIEKIKKDLLDFKTREIIVNETRNLRELLIAKAFAHDDSFDENPPGSVNDPLGFDPTKIQ